MVDDLNYLKEYRDSLLVVIDTPYWSKDQKDRIRNRITELDTLINDIENPSWWLRI